MNFRSKKVIISVSIALVLVLAAGITYFFIPKNSEKTAQILQSESLRELPPQTCPESIINSGNRQKVVYQGKELDVSVTNYSWVQSNCNNLFTGTDKKKENTDKISPTPLQMKPVLANLGIRFDNYSKQTGKAGDFVFNKSAIRLNSGETNKIMLEFGSTIQSAEGPKTFPEMIFNQLDINSQVYAMAEGKVINIERQESTNDYVLEVLFNNTNWVTIYDHITNLTVKMGDSVSSGQVLGTVSKNRDNKTGYIEIQIKYGNQNGSSTAYCPLDFMDSATKSQYSAAITQLMKDWESFYGNTSLFDESAQIVPGCVKSEVTE